MCVEIINFEFVVPRPAALNGWTTIRCNSSLSSARCDSHRFHARASVANACLRGLSKLPSCTITSGN